MGFTRNYKNFVSMTIMGSVGVKTSFDDTSISCMKDYYGTVRGIERGSDYFGGNSTGNCVSQSPKLTPLYIPSSFTESESRALGRYLCFGTGISNESIDDYKLENAVFTISSVGDRTYTDSILEDGSVKTTVSGTFQSSEDVTINEIGIVMYRSLMISDTYASSYYTSYPFLMWRKKLDTPISFVANTPIKLSFDIVMPNLVPSY